VCSVGSIVYGVRVGLCDRIRGRSLCIRDDRIRSSCAIVYGVRPCIRGTVFVCSVGSIVYGVRVGLCNRIRGTSLFCAIVMIVYRERQCVVGIDTSLCIRSLCIRSSVYDVAIATRRRIRTVLFGPRQFGNLWYSFKVWCRHPPLRVFRAGTNEPKPASFGTLASWLQWRESISDSP